MGLLNEFKQFAMRGNVVDMAVGVIIGAAFGKIVTSLVTDVVMPLLGLAIGGINFTEWKIILKAGSLAGVTPVIPPVTLNVGNFIQITFDFLIIAFVIFMALRTMNTLIQKEKDKEVAPPAPVISKEEELLAEIRDLLKNQK